MGDKLRMARKNKGLTMRDLSTQSNVSVMVISRIENGFNNPGIKILDRLIKALGIDACYLLSDSIQNHIKIPNNADNEIKEFLSNTGIWPYIFLAKKAQDSKIPTDLFSDLINASIKVRGL